MSRPFSYWNVLRKNIKPTLFAAAAFMYFSSPDTQKLKLSQKWNYLNKMSSNSKLLMNGFLKSYSVTSYCLSENQRKVLMSKPTDVYVWGNGIQAGTTMNYHNYYPKKIKNFSGKNDPEIIIVKFGDFHEAYLDKQGKIHICSKHKLPSIKLEGQDDWIREGMVTLEIKGRKVQDMAFTQNRLFALTNKGEVFVWIINYELPEEKEGPKGDFLDREQEEFDVEIVKEPIHIQELKNIAEITSGTDHFLARDKNGDVWAMGDDTFGQWGQYADNRPEIPPFKERRYRRPIKVLLPWKSRKIASGYRHSFAISDAGELYGWGYNNQQQLSHSEEFATETSQKHVMFEPVKITREIETKRVVDVDGGKDFSVIVTRDRDNIQEVWSTGNNLRGQLGINRISHLQDIWRLDDVSGFIDSIKQTPLNIAFLSWGRRHVMLVFEYGAFFIWGDNEQGQQGDRTRRMIESPFPKAKFELKHNVLNIEASRDNWAVIVERLPEDIRDKDDEDEKRKKKKSKRQAKTIQEVPKGIVKEPEKPSVIARLKEKLVRLWKKRQEEIEKMKENQKIKKEKKEKTDEQIIFDEVSKQNEEQKKN